MKFDNDECLKRYDEHIDRCQIFVGLESFYPSQLFAKNSIHKGGSSFKLFKGAAFLAESVATRILEGLSPVLPVTAVLDGFNIPQSVHYETKLPNIRNIFEFSDQLAQGFVQDIRQRLTESNLVNPVLVLRDMEGAHGIDGGEGPSNFKEGDVFVEVQIRYFLHDLPLPF